jgi:hypothetical protein
MDYRESTEKVKLMEKQIENIKSNMGSRYHIFRSYPLSMMSPIGTYIKPLDILEKGIYVAILFCRTNTHATEDYKFLTVSLFKMGDSPSCENTEGSRWGYGDSSSLYEEEIVSLACNGCIRDIIKSGDGISIHLKIGGENLKIKFKE